MRGLLAVNCTLGKLIRLAREQKGWPRTKLAEFAGISPNTMVKYEKAGEEGGQYPSSENLKKICALLEIDPRNAFDAIDYKDPPVSYIPTQEQDGEPIQDGKVVNFTLHFRSDVDWLNWKFSIRSIEDLDKFYWDVFGSFQEMRERLDRIEEMLKKNGPGDVGDAPSRSTNSENLEAVGAAPTNNHHPKDRSG